jgi:hypothetical protein
MRKFKRFKGHKTVADGAVAEIGGGLGLFLNGSLTKERSDIFLHWQNGMVGVFA